MVGAIMGAQTRSGAPHGATHTVWGPLVSADVERKKPIGFEIIGVYKLVTAGLSLALAFGMFRFFKADVRASLELLLRFLRLDPDNAIVHAVVERLAGLDRRRLLWIEAGTIGYAILHVIEGIGILRGKRWGGLLIILATSSLIPLECYEILRRRSLVRITALVLNLGIVVYLVVNRRKLTPERLPSRV
jgi:uncharacterized membrane protein (DUF2068 family)